MKNNRADSAEVLGDMLPREIDKLISERVFNLIVCDKWFEINLGSAGGPLMMKGNCGHGNNCIPSRFWNELEPMYAHYSTSIRDAWSVIRKMRENGFYISIQNCHEPKFEWCVIISKADDAWEHKGKIEESICLAALKSIGGYSEPGNIRNTLSPSESEPRKE